MKAKYQDRCKACFCVVYRGDEIGFRENFLLCEPCVLTFDDGMTAAERKAEQQRRRRAAGKAYRDRAARRAG